MHHQLRHRRLLITLCLVAGAFPTWGQTYPDKSITIVVPYPAGAAVDRIARGLGVELTKKLGQPVVIDNVGGASGTVGGKKVLRAAPDGYTLLLGTVNDTIVAPPALKAGYSAQDFTPIAKLSVNSTILVANPSFPAQNVDELVELGRKSQAPIMSGATGIAMMQTFGGTLVADAGGFKITHVPYRGGGPLLNDLMGGQVQLATIALPSALPLIRDGKLKALGVISAHRDPTAPNIPTVNEGRSIKGVEADLWTGLLGPVGLPAAVVDRLSKAVREIAADPAYRESEFKAGSVVVTDSDPQAFGRFLKLEEARMKPLIANVKVE